ncbi:hypothetical protein [Yersinia ruckeri]|uniref:hypothetical protein n=1 Tax=Yersinia ruckeri TaxID=29486 RepID=UPI00223813D3|nr:hypothetical protein [Yersinia ruckeri]MCW6598742.1 hypothetical protein [Yersinia ruckeri]
MTDVELMSKRLKEIRKATKKLILGFWIVMVATLLNGYDTLANNASAKDFWLCIAMLGLLKCTQIHYLKQARSLYVPYPTQ